MERNNDNKGPRIPENDPSKAMDSKREVEQSNDEKIDQDFPGYPHYPAKEDIMDGRTDAQRVDLDVENLPSGRNATGVSQRFGSGKGAGSDNSSMPVQDELEIRMGNEADVTKDDLAALDGRADEIGTRQNVSNEDLDNSMDVPGSELDDSNEDIGEEDEENNDYSLGNRDDSERGQ